MSYLHRPGAAAGGGSSTAGAAGAGAGAAAAAGGAPAAQHGGVGGAGAGMSGRLSDLLDYVKVEFEAVSSQAETLRRDNHEFAAHADMHLAEVSAIRRELTELEREHSRAKQAYEERIADLKRQLEMVRAQAGQGPPIPSVIPANTNHFGALMGHPHGMFGQGGPDRERVEMERERAAERDVKMVNGSNGLPQSSASGVGGPGPGPGHPQQGRPTHPGYGYQQQQHHQDGPERPHERDGAYQQQLGKRARPDESTHDAQPPSAKSRVIDGQRPNDNESRPSAASSFPPVRPPSRTFAQSPHNIPGRAISAAPPAPSIGNAPPSEPPVLSQAGPAGSSTSAANGDVKPTLNPPIQLQRLSSNTSQGTAQNHPTTSSTHEDRSARKPDGQAATASQPTQPRPPKQPDWDVTYNQEVQKKLEVTLAHTFLHDSVVCCVRISPDGKLLATGCNRNTTLYDTTTGAVVATLAEAREGTPDNYVRTVAFSPDGKHIASGSEDKIIRIWDLATRKLVSTLRGHDSEIYSLAFTPDGTQLVSGSGDRTARVWSLEQRRVLKELRIDETRKLDNGTVLDAGVTSIAISSDGKLLIAGSLDHIVRVWDLQTGALLDKLKNHKDSVYSVAFLPGGKQLLTGSLDKTLKIWDLTALRQAMANGTKIDPDVSHTTCKQTFVGHKDFVLSVATSPDGNYIASGSKDRAVQCWDVRTGKPQFVVHGHKNSVISIAMSEVGGFLATGSGDWQARLFRITGMETPAVKPNTQASSASNTRAPLSAKQQLPSGTAGTAKVSNEGAKDQAKTAPAPAEANGHDSSKESSAASTSASAVPAVAVKGASQPPSAPARADGPTTSAPAAEAIPAQPAVNAPSSPRVMKVEAPAVEAPSAEKAGPNRDLNPSAAPETKVTTGETNGDTVMADSPADTLAKS